MALSDIRNKVIELSGRYDLDDTEAYFGVDDLIRAGQKTLDKLLDAGKTIARNFQNLAYQQILVQIPGVRVIQKVSLVKSDERLDLTRVDYDELREYYYEKTSLITVGVPAYWSPAFLRPYPGIVTPASFNQQWAFDDIVSS